MASGSQLPTLPPGPDPIRRAARNILSGNEFRSPPRSPLDRLRSWFGDQISHLVSSMVDHRPRGWLGVLSLVVTMAVVGAVAWLIVRAVRGVGANPVRDGVPVAGGRRPPADWLAEADACAHRGDFRGALRARYRALVAELSARGLVEEVPGRTTGEYRRAVTSNLPGAASVFGQATDLFERAWYGDAVTTAEDDGRFRSLVSETLAGAR
jgi:hypothetical protein